MIQKVIVLEFAVEIKGNGPLLQHTNYTYIPVDLDGGMTWWG
jgi:hypothetical protein